MSSNENGKFKRQEEEYCLLLMQLTSTAQLNVTHVIRLEELDLIIPLYNV